VFTVPVPFAERLVEGDTTPSVVLSSLGTPVERKRFRGNPDQGTESRNRSRTIRSRR
jgi:hypothetical protein